MNRYEQTTIWQKTLGKQLEPDIYEKERDFLRVEFENFRSKAKLLAAEISSILPGFTVHDITHIDALWETAEIVTKDDFDLNPAEAFVLGGTFLIHDLGMGLAAFPNGIDELMKEPIWNDTVTALLKTKLNREVNKTDLLDIDDNITRAATENVLRLLHAKHAEKLALTSWTNKENQNIFLIDNTELREAYGSIIGLIAHSHWWNVEELESKLPKKLGAPGIFPSIWTIDPGKLACILRIADAIQIDDRRAPSFLRTIRKPSSISDKHWSFQQKLYQPRLEKDRLVFTSKSPFMIADVESWWICHDTLLMIDNELKEVDSFLVDTNRQRLKAIGVASIEDPKRLSRLIAVDGWQPVDTKIKVSNVAKLVGSLGGSQLYGENLVVPLRELIQNASDAIRARRLIEDEGEHFGDITIRTGKDNFGQYLEVEDNGVGMSQKILTGPFIDFGQSFWGTSLMHEELPGLESKGFSSTGKYGIGFFSVFMWGEKIQICSKRFESGRDTTLMLEFNHGASSRPILKKATKDDLIKDGGTRIRIWFAKTRTFEKLLEKHGRKKGKISMSELIETLSPSIDCNIILEEKGVKKHLIKANDWHTLKPIDLLKRIVGTSYFNELDSTHKKALESISKNMTLITEDDGNIVGRLLLYKEESSIRNRLVIEGIVTVGGMRTSGLSGLLGILIGNSERASRDIGIPMISKGKLSDWASNQATLLCSSNLNPETEIECASVVRSCRGKTSNLNIAISKKGPLTFDELKEMIKLNLHNTYLVVQDAAISNYERDNKCHIDLYENVIVVDVSVTGILQTRNIDYHVWWPSSAEDWFHSRSLEGLTTEAFAEIWGYTTEEILNTSDISTDGKSYNAIVGTVDGKEISIDHLDIIRKPTKK